MDLHKGKNNDLNCVEYRDLFAALESGNAINEIDETTAKTHLSTCADCAAFKQQHEFIAEAAANMPMFDVSESLTQKILQSVDVKAARVDLFLPLGITAGLVFLMLSPSDSLNGWIAWGAGGLGLCALQFLVKSADAGEQVI